MRWDNLPKELVRYILILRKFSTCNNKAAIKIESLWRGYRTRILITRFHMLRYLKDFTPLDI